MEPKLVITDSSKKCCVKVHRLSENILNLCMNNQPVILKKDIIQETLNNANELGDCSNVIEFNLELHAYVVDNNYIQPDNSVIEDDHVNYESLESCESNTNILSHLDQVKLRDLSVRVRRLSSDNRTFRFKSALCAKEVQRKSVFEKKGKSCVKKCKKKGNIIRKEISNTPHENKPFEESMLHKKCMLLEKYMKSLLLTNCTKNFLSNFKYSELAVIVKKLKNKSNKSRINLEFVSFLRSLIDSANSSKKKVKRKKCDSSRCIPEKNFRSSVPKKGENLCASSSSKFGNFRIHLGMLAKKEIASASKRIKGRPICRLVPEKKNRCTRVSSKSRIFHVHFGKLARKEIASTSQIISTGNPSISSLHEIAEISENSDDTSSGNIKEIQNNYANKNVENVPEVKKVLNDDIHIKNETKNLRYEKDLKKVSDIDLSEDNEQVSSLPNVKEHGDVNNVQQLYSCCFGQTC